MVLFLLTTIKKSNCQEQVYSISFELSVSEELQKEFKPNGRLFFFIDKNEGVETRLKNPFWWGGWCLFGKNYSNWDADEIITINSTEDWEVFQPNNFLISEHPEKGWHVQNEWGIQKVPEGIYQVQFLWDQNTMESNINSQGNMYSQIQEIEVNKSKHIKMSLSEIIPPMTSSYLSFLSASLREWC